MEFREFREIIPIIVFFTVIVILGIIYAAFFQHYSDTLFGFTLTDIRKKQSLIVIPICLLIIVGYTLYLSRFFGDGNIITGFNEIFVNSGFAPWFLNGLMLIMIIRCILVLLFEKD